MAPLVILSSSNDTIITGICKLQIAPLLISGSCFSVTGSMAEIDFI